MVETVKVVKDHRPGYAIINKSAFDPAKHTLYGVEDNSPRPGGRPPKA